MRFPQLKFLLIALSLLAACVERETGREIQSPPPAPPPTARTLLPPTVRPAPPPPREEIARREKKKKTDPEKPREKSRSSASASAPKKSAAGVYHVVEPGQTFWRICKGYGVSQEAVAQANGIADPTQIKVGQKLLIPGATHPVKIEPYPGYQKSGEIRPGKSSTPATRQVAVASPTRASAPTADPKPPAPGSVRLLWPVPGGKLYSTYGERDGRSHDGIDISASEGAPVLAMDDGRVTYSGDDIRGYGNMIVIKHAGNLSTVYAHNRKNLVHEGEMVRKGQKIAELGNTGHTSGPHCHVEIRVGKQPVNPLVYLKENP